MPIGQHTVWTRQFRTEVLAVRYAETVYPKDKTPRHRASRGQGLRSFVPNEGDKAHLWWIEEINGQYKLIFNVVRNVPVNQLHLW